MPAPSPLDLLRTVVIAWTLAACTTTPAAGPPATVTLVKEFAGGALPYACLEDSFLLGDATSFARVVVTGSGLETVKQYDLSDYLFGGTYGIVERLVPFESAGFVGVVSGEGMRFVRLSDNKSLGLLRPAQVPKPPLFTHEHYLYGVGTSESGLEQVLIVVNVANPAAPVIERQEGVTEPTAVAHDAGRFFLLERGALSSWSLQDPAHPKRVSTVTLGGSAAQDVHGVGMFHGHAHVWVEGEVVRIQVSDSGVLTATTNPWTAKKFVGHFAAAPALDALLGGGEQVGRWVDTSGGLTPISFPSGRGPTRDSCFAGRDLVYIHQRITDGVESTVFGTFAPPTP